MMNKKIIFVSEMKSPEKSANSTQIMTGNMLGGFRKVSCELIFVAIIEDDSQKEGIRRYYEGMCDKLIFVRDLTKYRNTRFLIKLYMLYAVLVRDAVRVDDEIMNEVTGDTMLISHSPSIDAALLCGKIKRLRPQIKYIQYWSDPMTLALITPEEYFKAYRLKRWILKFTEVKMHEMADRIVYGTKSLYDGQMEVFPEIRAKSVYVGVSCVSGEGEREVKNEKPVFGYFGNYYSAIRDIRPFYHAASGLDGCRAVICGQGDISLGESENVDILERVPQAEVSRLEDGADVEVCLLNKVGIQIPGKIFYHANRKRIIIVILDGPRKENIREELSGYNRFVFCENNADSIKETMKAIIEGRITPPQAFDSELLPENVCSHLIDDAPQ